MPIDKEQVQVIEAIVNSAIKFIAGMVILFIMVKLTFAAIDAPLLQVKALYLAFDTGAGVCAYQLFAHYFYTNSKPKKPTPTGGRRTP